MMFRRASGRSLTERERTLAAGIFGDAIALDRVRIHHRKWWPLQPRDVVMAPDGGIWFHPAGALWQRDFASASARLQALLIHELTHVWQHQRGLCLLVRRHPFCRYRYNIQPGRPLVRYGIEQQAMIVEHAFVARCAGKPDATLEILLKEAGLAA
jgi:hypothetical protein